MYLRLRKRKKPLPTDASNTTSPAPLASATEDPGAPTSSEWIPAEPAEGETRDGTDVSSPRHPNRGRAHESARGSHR